MSSSNFSWRKVIGGVLVAEVVLIAAAFLWVAVYSHLIAPGQEMSAYHQHAQASGPWVSVIVGVPVFYLLGHWLRSRRSATLLFGLYLALDVALLAAIPAEGSLPVAFIAVSYITKLASLLAGTRER